jgi:hypothetical protein
VTAERVLRAISTQTQRVLLAALIADAQLGAQELDAFMLRSRCRADQRLS